MRVQGMPDTCTGRHFFAFLHNGAGKAYFDNQAKQIKAQLDEAKRGRIVCVFAFLIGPQTESAKQLEEFGFKCTVDFHNYKYPDTSKRLFMFTRDMNDWEVGKSGVQDKVNPFAAPQPAPAIPQPVAVPEVPAVRRVTVETAVRHPWTNEPTGVRVLPEARTTSIGTRVYTALGTAGIRSTARLMAQPRTADVRGHVVTEDGRSYSNPFPVGEWIALNDDVRSIPPTLLNQRVDVISASGAHMEWTWGNWTGDGEIVAVKRIG